MSIRGFIWIIISIILFVVLTSPGLLFLLQMLFYLLVGWVFYLKRVLPEVQIGWSGVGMGATCLVLLAFGLHGFMRWMAREVNPGQVWKRKWTGAMILGVIALFVSGMSVAGVTHQVGWLLTSKEPLLMGGDRIVLQRMQSINNLKQIGFSVWNYETEHSSFPPGTIVTDSGQPLHGWPTLLLPYMELTKLSNKIDLSLPWNDPTNAAAFQTHVYPYMNPRLGSTANPGEYARIHYASNARVLGGDRRLTARDFTDGTSSTIIGGEVAGQFKPWGHPVQWRDLGLGINQSPDGFGSPFPGGAQFMMADGSVKFLKNSISPTVLKALATPNGGEVVLEDSYE